MLLKLLFLKGLIFCELQTHPRKRAHNKKLSGFLFDFQYKARWRGGREKPFQRNQGRKHWKQKKRPVEEREREREKRGGIAHV